MTTLMLSWDALLHVIHFVPSTDRLCVALVNREFCRAVATDMAPSRYFVTHPMCTVERLKWAMRLGFLPTLLCLYRAPLEVFQYIHHRSGLTITDKLVYDTIHSGDAREDVLEWLVSVCTNWTSPSTWTDLSIILALQNGYTALACRMFQACGSACFHHEAQMVIPALQFGAKPIYEALLLLSSHATWPPQVLKLQIAIVARRYGRHEVSTHVMPLLSPFEVDIVHACGEGATPLSHDETAECWPRMRLFGIVPPIADTLSEERKREHLAKMAAAHGNIAALAAMAPLPIAIRDTAMQSAAFHGEYKVIAHFFPTVHDVRERLQTISLFGICEVKMLAWLHESGLLVEACEIPGRLCAVINHMVKTEDDSVVRFLIRHLPAERLTFLARVLSDAPSHVRASFERCASIEVLQWLDSYGVAWSFSQAVLAAVHNALRPRAAVERLDALIRLRESTHTMTGVFSPALILCAVRKRYREVLLYMHHHPKYSEPNLTAPYLL